jgi:hypothetical protein
MCQFCEVDGTLIKVCSMITRRTILFYVQAPLFICAFSCGLWIVDFRDSYLLSHIPSGTSIISFAVSWSMFQTVAHRCYPLHTCVLDSKCNGTKAIGH